jgi:signal transduction histidine kinase
MFDSRRVRLSLDAPPCEMDGDPELLKQVFLNLLINAVQAMPDGGVIDARIEREGSRAAVVIRDTGAGIAPEHIEKIFDPFFTTKDEGTGLGLAIVNTIMQANNGFVNVSSEPGEGSTFRLYFPLNEEPICRGDAGSEGTFELVDTEHSEQLPEPHAKYGLAYYSF